MKSKFKKNLIAAASVLALSCVAVGGVLTLNTSDGLVDTTAKKTASLVAAAESTRPASEGNTIYVSPDVAYDSLYQSNMGSGTVSDPYNITYLFENASTDNLISAGDTIVMLPGTYSITKPIKIEACGTYDNYITIIAAADYDSSTYSGDTVLSFYGMSFASDNRGVQINGDYIYWYNIDICGAGDNGMYVAGDYNIIENCEFYNNRDTGLQLGRAYSDYSNIDQWPSYNLIKNCSSYNNYDNETYGENADGFAAKLTVGYGNIFDGCIAYRNSDDGWDLYAKADSGNIGCVIIYNCVAFENGFLMESQATCNARFSTFNQNYKESDTTAYTTRDGDGNGFKLGGGSNEGDVILYNCMTFNNRMHGVTDNSNPGTLMITGVTSYNNGVGISSTGEIDYTASTESCANIDVARWDYSYNVLSDVLSVTGDSAKTTADAYRGSAENSMFTSTYITSNIDSDSDDTNKQGTAYTATGSAYSAPTKAIFSATPATTLGTTCGTYSDTTCQYGTTIHSQYRNSDGSINMGTILAITDYSGLVSSTIGCELNKTSWDDYTHYDYTLLTGTESSDAAQAAVVEHLLYVPVNLSACYQDFDVVTHMIGYDITWTSENSDILSVGTDITTTVSSSESLTVTVYRPATDTVVKLIATVTVGSTTVTKDFAITVKAGDYEVGDIVADGVENDELIIDQYKIVYEPSITVYDGSDYNGKILSSDNYTVETTYMYSEDVTSTTYYEVAGFSASVAGVFTITKTVTVNNADTTDATKTGSYTYTIYVASSSKSNISLTDPTVTVNKEGFILEASPSNPTGYLYVYVADSAIEGITSEQVIANGEKSEFRTTEISEQYTNANSASYVVYYVVTDLDGENMSEVYSLSVGTVEIATTADFEAMLAESDSSKIYLLTADIDYGTTEGETVTRGTLSVSSQATFSALLNGNGYTIKNIDATQYIFASVKNGTIMNVKFDNISLTLTDTTYSGKSSGASGIIGVMNGGYIYNVAITDVNVFSKNQRTGGLIGQITATSGTGSTTYIENVSLVNSENYSITLDGVQRGGGLIGFVQAGNASGWTEIYITDCYVNTDVSASFEMGLIIGTWSDQNANDYLSITNCVTNGTLTASSSKSYCGGILGYNKDGNGTLVIDSCVSTVTINFGGVDLTAAVKNASGIVGGFSTAATVTVTNCYSWFADYNDEYEVDAISAEVLKLETWWNNTGFDLTDWTIDTESTSPYISLNYLS